MKGISFDLHRRLFIASFSSVPFYCSPFVISIVSSQPDISISKAGLFAAVMMVSQLVFILMTPAFSIIDKNGYLLKAVLLATAIALPVAIISGLSFPALLGCAALIGCSSAVLFSYGTNISLSAANRQAAFLIRLSYTLLATGVISTVLVAFEGNYGIALVLGAISLFYLLSGFFLIKQQFWWQPPATEGAQMLSTEILALFLVFIFFVGQTGFYIYHASFYAGQSGSLLALSTSRVFAGAAIFLLPVLLTGGVGPPGLVGWLVLQVSCVLAIYLHPAILVLFVVAIIYEISLNFIASHMQAMAGGAAKVLAPRFLAPVIILAAATGPFLFFSLANEFHAGWAVTLSCLLFSTAVIAMIALSRSGKMKFIPKAKGPSKN